MGELDGRHQAKAPNLERPHRKLEDRVRYLCTGADDALEMSEVIDLYIARTEALGQRGDRSDDAAAPEGRVPGAGSTAASGARAPCRGHSSRRLEPESVLQWPTEIAHPSYDWAPTWPGTIRPTRTIWPTSIGDGRKIEGVRKMGNRPQPLDLEFYRRLSLGHVRDRSWSGSHRTRTTSRASRRARPFSRPRAPSPLVA